MPTGWPTSGRKADSSLPSWWVMPDSTGTFWYWPARMAAIGSVGTTVPSGMGPDAVVLGRPPTVFRPTFRMVLAGLPRR